jgi:hypothetical protein
MAMSSAASYPGDDVPIIDRLTSVPKFLVEVDAVVAAGGQ